MLIQGQKKQDLLRTDTKEAYGHKHSIDCVSKADTNDLDKQRA